MRRHKDKSTRKRRMKNHEVNKDTEERTRNEQDKNTKRKKMRAVEEKNK